MKHKIAFAIIMGFVTTGIISFTLISINIGYGNRFINEWLRTWAIAYTVVIPCILFLSPLAKKLVNKLLGKKQKMHPFGLKRF